MGTRIMRSLRCASLVFLLLASSSWADSDGHYCVGRDYVAYQFGLAQPPVAPHRIYVVRLGGEQGIADAGILEIPQFQVHGMRCGGTAIQIEAWHSLYTVHLDESRRPVRYEMARWEEHPDYQRARGNQPRLGGYGFQTNGFTVSKQTLLRTETGYEFLLEIESKPLPSRRCDAAITTRLIESDGTGNIVRERVLFRGTGFIADCHGHVPGGMGAALIRPLP